MASKAFARLLAFPLLARHDADLRTGGRDDVRRYGGDICQARLQVSPASLVGNDRDLEGVAVMRESGGA